MNPATLTPDERGVYDTELAQLRGSKEAVVLAERAVELHRWTHSKDKVITAVSRDGDRVKALAPMPINANALKLTCLAEAERLFPSGSIARGYLGPTRLAWAIIALAEAISPKHASAAFFEDKARAARARMTHKHLRPEAEAFGRTLQVEWVDEVRRAS